MIDTHAHLDSDEFRDDLEAVLERAAAAGVEAIVSVAVSAASAEAIVALADRRPQVFAAVGIHPNYVHEAAPNDWDRVVALVDHPRVTALGETGLDRHWDVAPFDLQQEYFARHLELSRRTGLPVIVHTRDCEADALAMIGEAARYGPLRGVMHSFTGTPAAAAQYLEWGLFISFAGMTTFKKSQELRDTARGIPADRILIETDSPYLSPHPLRGKRNEPANVALTAQVLADARGESLSDFVAQTSANARRLLPRLR